jgi:hypothetical protein
MKKTAVFLAAAALFLMFVNICRADDKTLLRYRLEKGKTYSCRYTCDEEVTLELRGFTLSMDIKNAAGVSYYVEDIDQNGDATVVCKYETIYFKSRTPWGPVQYDSTDPPVYLAAGMQVFDSLLGQKVTLKVSPDGRVKDIQGIDELLSRILARMDLPDGPEGVMFVKSVREMFGEKAVQDFLKGSAGLYSDNPVGIGETWSRTGLLSLAHPLPVEYRYRLMSLKDGIATLDVNSKIKKGPGDKAEPAGKKGSYQLSSGTEHGEIEVDSASGWVIRGRFKQKLSGRIKSKGAPIPVSVESTATFGPRVDQPRPEIEIMKAE